MSDIFGGPPDDEGYDPLGYPTDYAEVEDPYGFYNGEIPTAEWYDNVTLFDGETLTNQQWHDLVIQDVMTPGVADELYGVEAIDIIYELDDMGYWTDEDWETFRAYYGEQ
jgi:hypothetical protein